MDLSSSKAIKNDRLLAVEELFRQKQYGVALQELSSLDETAFPDRDYERGLFLSLRAHGHFLQGRYRESLQDGIESVKLLASSPFNSRYGHVQMVLCRAYVAAGDLVNAEIRGRDALAAFRRGGDDAGQMDAFNNLAHIAYVRGNYKAAASLLDNALELATDQAMECRIESNLGQILVRTGDWSVAEEKLQTALEYHAEHKHEVFQVNNLLSLGMLQLRSRRFILAGRTLDRALEIIGRLKLRREKVIYLEYSGELALERGEAHKAKSILSQAYENALLAAPESDKVSQSSRLLAEAELALDNVDEALKYGQKALDVSLKVEEKLEVALSKRVVARAFAARNDFSTALEYIDSAVQLAREVGDPFELARTLLVLTETMLAAGAEKREKISTAFEHARQLFVTLGLDYWIAETDYRSGIHCCSCGDLASGFQELSQAEHAFGKIGEKARVSAVHNYLKTLSKHAVVAAMSQDNEFKIFGNMVSSDEMSDINNGNIEEILNVLLRRTGGDRVVLFSPESDPVSVEASFALTPHQVKNFAERFLNLLGQEFARSKPSLLLDSRRDPFINELFGENADTVASVMVIPVRLIDKTTSFLYIDRLSSDNGLRPFNQTELNFAVGFSDIIAFKWAEIQKNKLLEDNLRLKSQLREKAAFPNIITQSAQLLDMLMQVRQVVNSNISITIEGETGTGKDLLVRAIHYNSHRRDRRFMSVNCAALPETLLESELFGYRRGAFTGADRDKAGLFEEADGGTFFLDEIGDMPLNIQAKVLRVLEEKELVRLGETTPRQVDVRIISATNRDLRDLMSSGQFRQDLYYRLSALTFRLPPLRERKEDIPLLIDHFLRNTGKRVGPELMKMLIGYDWPGNIRELENEIKKLVLLAGEGEVITTDAVSPKIAGGTGAIRAEKAKEIESSEEIVFDETYSLYDYLAYHEKRFIIKALKEKNGVKKHAAELLNIPESTLRLKIKQYDINLKSLR